MNLGQLFKVGGATVAGYGDDKREMLKEHFANLAAQRAANKDAIDTVIAQRTLRTPVLGDPAYLEAQRGLKKVDTDAAVDQATRVGPITTQTAVNTAKGVAPITEGTHQRERLFDNDHQPNSFTTTQVGGDPSVPGSGQVVSVNTKTGERGHTIGTAKPTGMVTPTQRGQREEKLHDDYQQEQPVKHAAALAGAVAQLRASAAQRTPQGDLNMIYGAVKLRDPNAVKEGELKLQTSARSLGTHVIAAWNKAASGQILTDQERAEIMDLVNEMVTQQDRLVAPVQARFGERARAVGADSAFVAPDPFAGARNSKNRPPGFVR